MMARISYVLRLSWCSRWVRIRFSFPSMGMIMRVHELEGALRIGIRILP